jgi:hypothetical protein
MGCSNFGFFVEANCGELDRRQSQVSAPVPGRPTATVYRRLGPDDPWLND